MTIHASKGLEFEAVLLLELDAAQGGRGDVILWNLNEPPRIVPAKKDAPFLGLEELTGAQVSSDFMEELSVLYVGMTRARSFLDIILREGSKAPLAALLKHALQVDADRVVEEFDGLSMREIDEARGRGGTRPDQADPGIAGAAVPVPRKASAIFAGRAGHSTPSGRSEDGLVSVTNILAPARGAMRRGELVHALLRQISWIEDGAPDRDTLVNSTLQLTAGLGRAEVAGCAERLIEEARTPGTELHRALTKPPGAKGEVIELWRERAFAVIRNSSGRPEVLSGTFDRVVLWRDARGTALRATIVDFKTDRFASPHERAQIESRYAPQLSAYCEALRLLCPGLDERSISTSLVCVSA
jgi:ATP-dependent helicase/nuclease subunit A